MQLGRMRPDGDGVAVEASGKKLRRFAPLLAAFAVGCGAAAAAPAVSIVGRVVTGLGALVCAVFAVTSWRQGGRDVVPLFRIVDDGIEHARAGLVTWDEIEDVRVYSISGQRALGIWTRDPYLVARRVGSWWIRPMAFLNRLFGYAPISFTDRAVPVDEVLAEIEARRRRAGAAP